MTDEVVLEGEGTAEEMEAHLIQELKQREWLAPAAIELIERELEPPVDGKGRYRVRIKPPRTEARATATVRWDWR
ncbi:MAG: hypothetical protein KY456_10550 [Chloroflexi bacterium]|nr:hypothetical protein [Chloroflexota bacterium]